MGLVDMSTPGHTFLYFGGFTGNGTGLSGRLHVKFSYNHLGQERHDWACNSTH